MSAIDNLRAAVEAAAGGQPFPLNAAFLTAGLDDAAVTVPPDYDAWLRQAFFLELPADFTVAVAKADVGKVEGAAFTVKKATVPFVGAKAPLAARATLVFTVEAGTLVVQVETTPAGWTWTDSFAFMGAFPFDQFAVLSGVAFVFSSEAGTYPYGNSAGRRVSGGAVQNLFATVPLPTIVAPFLPLFDGLAAPAGDLLLSGPLNMGAFDGQTVLFPPGRLSATIQNGTFDLVYLKVRDPSVTITIPAPDGSSEVGGVLLLADPDEDPDAGDQAPTLSISSRFDVGNDGIYALDVAVTPGDTTRYTIALSVAQDGKPITPAGII
ncbi:hypothetical protein MPAR168_06170 [Methylorubrum populi]|uniref:Uncharacterized protein n=1 Tax=Methylobacterium radiotolerans TaxID=31998 RepID=A0ABU7TGW5_9HYPH